jgi:hypothetical protein
MESWSQGRSRRSATRCTQNLQTVFTPLLMTFHRHAGFGWPRSDILDLCDAIGGSRIASAACKFGVSRRPVDQSAGQAEKDIGHRNGSSVPEYGPEKWRGTGSRQLLQVTRPHESRVMEKLLLPRRLVEATPSVELVAT